MTQNLNVFDAYGFVRTDLEDKEVAKCSPEQLAVLMPLLEAVADTKAADAAEIEVIKNKNRAETALQRAKDTFEAALPKHTAHDEWRRTVKGEILPPPSDEVIKKVKAATKVVEAAEKFVAICISEIGPAKLARSNARAKSTALLMEWAKMDGSPKNVGHLIKQRSATETKIKLDNIAKGMPADFAVGMASSVGPSFLDQFRAGQGKGHSADRGYNLNKMRGAQLPSK